MHFWPYQIFILAFANISYTYEFIYYYIIIFIQRHYAYLSLWNFHIGFLLQSVRKCLSIGALFHRPFMLTILWTNFFYAHQIVIKTVWFISGLYLSYIYIWNVEKKPKIPLFSNGIQLSIYSIFPTLYT